MAMEAFSDRWNVFTTALGSRRYAVADIAKLAVLVATAVYLYWYGRTMSTVEIVLTVLFVLAALFFWVVLEYALKLTRQISDARLRLAQLRVVGVELRNEVVRLTDRPKLKDWETRVATFFKHADRDPEGALDDFGDCANDLVLYAATTDLMLLCGNRVPIEAWAFLCWHHALHFDPQTLQNSDPQLGPQLGDVAQLFAKVGDKWFLDLRQKRRAEQKRQGKEVMLSWLRHPDYLNFGAVDRTQIRFWKD